MVAGERDKWALGSRNEIQASLVLLVSLFIVATLVPLFVVTTDIRPRSKCTCVGYIRSGAPSSELG